MRNILGILLLLLAVQSSYNAGFVKGERITLQKIRDKKINGYWFIPIKKEVLDKLMEEEEKG